MVRGLKFFCDENITSLIEQKIKEYGFMVSSVRSERLFGLKNGELLQLIQEMQLTLITFDKDFLDIEPIPDAGIVVIDIHPTNNGYVLPVLERFLVALQQGNIDLTKQIFRMSRK